MSGPVIIRLQNLPLEARSIDIRRFFEGLLIPDGGVHIIGGARGDAFIAFQSDEDARQAMNRDMHPLCGTAIKLFLSSKTEMQNVIASARQAPAVTAPPTTIPPTTNPLDFLSKYVTSSAPTFQAPLKPEVNIINQLTSSINPGILDQLKNINQILPGLQSPASANAPQKTSDAPAKPNVSIDQILGILQSHLQPAAAPPVTTTPAPVARTPEVNKYQRKEPTPERENYNQRYNNYNSTKDRYNSDKSSSYNEEKNYMSNNSRYENTNRNGSSYNSQQDSKFGQRVYVTNSNKYESAYQSTTKRKYEDQDRGFNNNRGNNNFDESREKQYPGKYQVGNGHQSRVDEGHLSPSRPALEPIIRVKNFNNNCSYKDVRTFLQGIQIEHDGIKLLTDFNNQRNGSAFVKLLSITDLKKALCRNKQYYEDKTIIVTQSSEAEFDAATNFYSFTSNTNRPDDTRTKPNQIIKKPTFTQVDQGSDSGFYLKIYGLPVKFDENDLRSMFNNVNFVRMTTATPTPITSTNVNNGQTETVTSLKAKKICEVETQLDLERALTRQDEQVGKSKLKIYQIDRAEYDREIAHAVKYGNKSGEDQHTNGGGYKLNAKLNDENISDDLFSVVNGVQGLNESDLREFFEDINVIAIFFVQDTYTHYPTGEACCHFSNKKDCDLALIKDSQFFRGRPIQVSRINFLKYHHYVQKHLETLMTNGDTLKRRVLLGEAPIGRQLLLDTPTSSQSSTENGLNHSSNGNDFNKRRNYNETYTNGNKRTKPSNNYNEDSRSPGSAAALPPLPEEFARYRNKLILISNIAYEASRDDILGLVAKFSPIESTLKIRHDDQGRPAGDAVVAFQSTDDADRAAEELDGFSFMGDKVRATLFSSN